MVEYVVVDVGVSGSYGEFKAEGREYLPGIAVADAGSHERAVGAVLVAVVVAECYVEPGEVSCQTQKMPFGISLEPESEFGLEGEGAESVVVLDGVGAVDDREVN